VLDLSRFNPTQRTAILAGDGPLLIVAGPGSGKTTVLAARITHLVTARGVAPTSILALTFATKASRELRVRLAGLLGAAAQGVDVATFHAFGLRVVRQWSETLGWGSGPLVVYGADDSRRLLRDVARACEVDLEQWPLGELATRLERYRLAADGSTAEPSAAALATITGCYEDHLRRRGAVDYPAMLALPLRLLDDKPEALRLLQDSYRHVLCDEFQDVCAAQFRLLTLLAREHRNLVVVGDPMQTLYGWRGADVRFLHAFERDFPDARVVSLDQNFRATRSLVDLANALGAPLPYAHRLWTDNPPGEPPRLHVAKDEQTEARFVATEISRLCAEGRIDHPGEVAVLYRTNRQAEHLTLALREQRLPYRVRGAVDLFARREVRDAVAYLRLAHTPSDVTALARIVNTPPRHLVQLVEILRQKPIPIGDLPTLAHPYGVSAVASALALDRLIADLHARSADLPPALLLDEALDRSGYRRWLEGQADGPEHLSHLATLRALAQQAETGLGPWLVDLQLGEDLPASSDDAGTVVLTTIHGAKGGEWRVVFVVGFEEGLLPHARALVGDASEPDGIDSERRVAYVAVTRPREGLYLLYCENRRWGERQEPRRPSRFLRGLPLERIERVA